MLGLGGNLIGDAGAAKLAEVLDGCDTCLLFFYIFMKLIIMIMRNVA